MQLFPRHLPPNRRRSRIALGLCFLALACVIAGWLLEGPLLATEAVTGRLSLRSADFAPLEASEPPSPLISPDQKLVLQGAVAGFALAIFVRLCFAFLRGQPTEKRAIPEQPQPSGS